MGLKKSEIDKWTGSKAILDPSAGGWRTAFATESLAKVFMLVILNTIFLLATLHFLHSGGDFDKQGASRKCINTVRSTVTRQPHEMSTVGMLDSSSLSLKNESIHINVRQFETYGVSVHLFIKMSAHRAGPKTFAIIGLEAKNAAELYNDPPYRCVWIPGSASITGTPVKGHAFKMQPDTGNVYSRLYSAIVVNCTFHEDVGIDKKGGKLVLYASYGESYFRKPERIVALMEAEDDYKGVDYYNSPVFKYDYIYCGSPLFGNLSPERIREWMAYHAHFFGQKSHFFIYDAGGVHGDVRRVLDPWIEAGRVTIDDIREQEIFDGYYHNQFMVVNDCFHRARYLAPWLFFFDVDEYMWLPPTTSTLASVLQQYEDQTQIIIWQKPMSRMFCMMEGNATNHNILDRKWGFEKLVFRNIRTRESYDCKYAIQARKAMATGVHRSGHLIGSNDTSYGDPLTYYHYHNTINRREELCQEFLDPNNIYVNPSNKDDMFVYDDGMAVHGNHIREFELNQIGTQPFII